MVVNSTKLTLFFLALVLMAGGYAVNPACAAAKNKEVFTRYNIHVQGKADRSGVVVYKASYANYVDSGAGHEVIPANTPIVFGRWRGGFSFDTLDGKKVFFEYKARNMGMSAAEYQQLITSPTPVSLAALSAEDRKGVAKGKAFPGMTRNGVMTALGYPATHRTPSLESETWVYWRNRFRTLEVDFDDAGKVKEIR